jgi:predicted ABC-type transport system involved in lysophospholipase L1 biosynthesis ATPase subunit
MFTRGRTEGREEGLAGMRAALRTVLEVRGLAIDEPIQVRIAACSDIEQLRVLIARAATTTRSADLFADEPRARVGPV